jgi:hypothetical protein
MPTSTRRGIARRTVLALTLGVLTVGLVAPIAEAATPKTKRVSVSSNGTEGNEVSRSADITPDGRFVRLRVRLR